MNRVLEDIEMAKKIIKEEEYYNFFGEYSHIYPFTTENIKGYLNEINPFIKDDDNFLVPCASTDHLLNLVGMGARNIDTFDISIFPKYYMYLKLAALKELKFDEFKQYLFCDGKNANLFAENNYVKLRGTLENMDQSSLVFWDGLYDFAPGHKIILSKLFSDGCGKGFRLTNNFYTDESIFNEIKERLDMINIDFYHCDIEELPLYIHKKYRCILLSNINDYTPLAYTPYSYGRVFKIFYYDKLIGEDLAKQLLDDDSYIVCYFYNKKRDGQIKNSHFSYISIPSAIFANKPKKRDTVLVYKKGIM